MVNNRAVPTAPTHTLLQGTFTSGSTLKIIAKRAVITAKETAKLRRCKMVSDAGMYLLSEPVIALRNVVSASETRSRKPMPRIMAKDKKRVRMKPQIPIPGLDFTSQIVLSDS